MKKYLITGFSGFVGYNFLEYLENIGESSSVLGIDIAEPNFVLDKFSNISCSFEKLDLLNKDEVENIIYQYQPDYILHLASYSSVAFSWKNPVLSFRNNTNIFLNLLEAVREINLRCRILSIGSSEEYGNVNEEHLPLKEDMILDPVSPYAVARVSQELLSWVYVNGYDLDIIMTRSFNHIGPGQKEIFVIASFAKQIMEMKENGESEGTLIAGDTSIVRDFLDVRDVVAAYYTLFQKGKKGEVYNICSGKGHSLKEIVEILSKIVKIKINIELNPDFIRPNDNKIIVGSNEKIVSSTQWDYKIPIEESLKDILFYWKA
ncbi:MAG: NAD-dependent epimerase/dehydratase family protein [bacterium]|nr:NAD-dependent epimerase/dehydratase family protein [bacterium]